MNDRRKALWWHRIELGLVAGLLVFVIVGWGWSELKNGPALVETKARG